MVAFLEAFVPPTAARRIVAAVMLICGLGISEAARMAGFPKSTVGDLSKRISRLGSPSDVGGLLSDAPRREAAEPLGGVGERLVEDLRKRNFFTLRQIREHLLQAYGVGARIQAISEFLHSRRISKRKCGSIPAKADPEAQRRFWDEKLAPRLREARAGERVVLFTDASHFVVNCDFLARVWCESRRFMRTLSGRQRHNVLGALDYVTMRVTTVTNNKYINAESVIELIGKVATEYGTANGGVVTIVLDNARYQKCKAVWECAESNGVELLYLPPYSPNLNPIERLWRMVKSDLRTRGWKDFKEFCDIIDELVASTTGANEQRVRSLIAEDVQLFDGYEELFPGTYEAPRRAGADAA